MKNEFQIADIIVKCVQRDVLNNDELFLIEDWLKNEENKNTFEGLIDGKGLEAYQKQIKKYDSVKALNNVLDKSKLQKRRSIISTLSKVAAVMIPAFFIVWATMQSLNKQFENNAIAQADMENRTSTKAVLLLGNGESVELDGIEENSISEQDGTVISNNKGLITYDTSSTAVEQIIYNTIRVPRGGEYQLVLSDGTKVWLNSESEIKYPVKFIGNTRDVWVNGELYFDVFSDKTKPFKINANGMGIEVLGTEFNVEAYNDNNSIITTLIEGSVKITSGDEGFVMKPNDQLVFNKSDHSVSISHVNASTSALWKEGVFYAEAESLSEIMDRLARWYNVDVKYVSPSLKNKRFSIEVKRYSDISKVLNILSATQKVNFNIEGNKITVMK